MTTKLYYCWLTVLVASYQDGLIAGLAKKGYMVGPAAKSGQLVAPGSNASALISFSLYGKDDKVDAQKVHEDVMEVLKNMKAFCHSIIVSESADCCWYGSNFDIPGADKPPPPKPTPTKKSTMN